VAYHANLTVEALVDRMLELARESARLRRRPEGAPPQRSSRPSPNQLMLVTEGGDQINVVTGEFL